MELYQGPTLDKKYEIKGNGLPGRSFKIVNHHRPKPGRRGKPNSL